MKKYISVESLEKAFNLNATLGNVYAYNHFGSLINNAQEMVLVEDIEKAVNARFSDIVRLKDYLKEVIGQEPEKFGGLTIKQWGQLSKHPYIRIDADYGVKFLSGLSDYEDIKELLPDLENMTRTDLDLPDGIKIVVTTRSSFYNRITPLDKYDTENIKHYRILGVAKL